MALLEWNDRLSVNIREIDDQHKKLVDMVNRLHAAMKEGKADAIAMQIVADMKNYAASHFATEERHMKTHGYPDYPAHKTEHDKFVAKVVAVEKDLRSGKCALSMDILNFLSNWLVNHIKGTDKKYSPFLNKAGVV
ncbi:MAG: bacteriohemerythrin [Desulfovibrionaceae bacterium]|nr:bacteriohemerythrin [Desulfovibrionaceae bacterium]